MKQYIIHVEFESGLKNQFTVMAENKSEARRKGKEMIVNPSINYGYEYWAEEAPTPQPEQYSTGEKITKEIQAIYESHGAGDAKEAADKYFPKLVGYEYCPGCDDESPVLKDTHDCLLCGMTTAAPTVQEEAPEGDSEYPIKDDVWPSRRWNKDRTDYIDLSGGEHPVQWIAWGETITVTNHNDINVRINPSGNYNSGIPSTGDRRQAEELVKRYNGYQQQAKDIELLREALQNAKTDIYNWHNTRGGKKLTDIMGDFDLALKQTEPKQ